MPGVVDLHRPDAVRVLDLPHAVEHLGTAAQAAFGPGTPAAGAWLARQRHALRQGAEDAVLTALADLAATPGPGTEAAATIQGAHACLATRRAHIRARAFAAAGYPIGSGRVESAHTLVVKARRKGAGMHRARPNVDPMLALRTVVANGRWDEAWPRLWRQARIGRRRGHRRTHAPTHPSTHAAVTPPAPRPAPRPAATRPAPAMLPPTTPRPKLVVDGKPTRDHPWKRGPALHAQS